jgi:glycosyltransferase involved in cell wall biosynthesis
MLQEMRIIALLASYNEERFIGACIEHLRSQGLDAYLIDNASTDRTVSIASRYLDNGLIHIETLPRHGQYSWTPILERKEELATELEADWFMHVDPDEIRLPPNSKLTLAKGLVEAERQRFNAVDFLEFTFVPTLEQPNHDHLSFQNTMRSYYPFRPHSPNQLKAWKNQKTRVDLVSSGGHRVSFPGIRVYPIPFKMRHYLFLSLEHATRKYFQRRYDPAEVSAGLHRARAAFRPEAAKLLSSRDLRAYVSDDLLDPSSPRTRHPLFETEEM